MFILSDKMANIVLPNSFDASNISIGPLKVLDSGAKQAFVSYGGDKFTIQTAVDMYLPFGLNVFDKNGPPEYSIDISFRDHDKRPEIGEFLSAMAALDEKMIQEGVKNARAWFKTEPNPSIIKAFYSPCVKYSTDKEGNLKPYPPTLKLKLKRINGDVETKFYDVHGNLQKDQTVAELLPKGARITALAQCTGVWLAGGKFGLSWRTKQVVIHSVPETIRNFAIKLPNSGGSSESIRPAQPRVQAKLDTYVCPTASDETEEDTETNDDSAFAVQTTPQTASVVHAVMPSLTQQPQSTADSQPEDVEEVDVEPIPVPAKKVIVKKKFPAPGGVKKT